MTLLLLLAVAGVETPLGPYARPGVPVLLRSDTPIVVDLDGWTYRVDGTTPVFAAAVPCAVRGGDGTELRRLEDPGDRALTGVIGDAPKGLADAVPVDPAALGGGSWRALDIFDRLLVTVPVRGDEPWFRCVAQWVNAGGSLAVADARRLFPEGTGLGAAADGLEGLPPPRLPRPGNVRPDVYALVEKIEEGSPALRAARGVVLGAAAACALLLALSRRLRARPVLLGAAAVALLGALVGLLRTRADYTPLARGRIEISWFKGGVERRRTYLVYRHAGPGAVAPRAPEAAPILYAGSNRTPWWRGPGEEVPVEDGRIIRVFLVEEILRAPEPPPFDGPAIPKDLWSREAPRRGGAKASASPVAAPAASRAAPLLLGIRAVVQD